MPYARNADLPTSIRRPLPDPAQTVFRTVVNAKLKAGEDEESAFRQGWAAVSRQYTRTEGGKWVAKKVQAPLYSKRHVLNEADIIKWAKGQGFKKTQLPSDLHVTLMYSKDAVEWPKDTDADEITIRSTKGRAVTALGDGGAVVLKFESTTLKRRWQELIDKGASWSHDDYTPHITITWDAGDVDISKMKPYDGPIVLGPEVFQEVDDGWKATHTEKRKSSDFRVWKVMEDMGLIFGWAIVCKKGGNDYYDLQNDHIPEDAMLEAAADFMEHRRSMKIMHKGKEQGKVIFAWPLTAETCKAMGLASETMGLMVAVKPTDKKFLAAAKTGKFTGFSIGGSRIVDEEVEEDDEE